MSFYSTIVQGHENGYFLDKKVDNSVFIYFFWTRKQVLNESSLLVIRYFTLLISIQFHFLLHKNMFYDKEKESILKKD